MSRIVSRTAAVCRVSRPVKTVDGDYLADGWAAWQAVEGDHDTDGRWSDVIATGVALHAALVGVPKPDFIEARAGVWSIGDRVAWQEQPRLINDPVFARIATDLESYLAACTEPDQLIHGDLTANVLFSDQRDPAVIDFTPYWRPASFGLAIVAVDAVCWYGADASVFDLVSGTEDVPSRLARAALYRLVTSDEAAQEMVEPDRSSYLSASREAYAHVLARLASWRNRMK